MNRFLRYDGSSAYELSPGCLSGLHRQSKQDYTAELSARIALEKQRKELHVYYYRIGHVLAYPLPVRCPNMQSHPEGIPGLPAYPWFIWFMWTIKERWDVLHVAWRRFGDAEAGRLLQEELAATVAWDRGYTEQGNRLGTGHLAVCLSNFLQHPQDWDPQRYELLRQSAAIVLERDIVPYVQKVWLAEKVADDAYMPNNIPIIILIGGLYVAETLGHAMAQVMESQLGDVLQLWKRKRLGGECYTEGVAYDGFWLDALTDWQLARRQRPQPAGLEEATLSFGNSCLHLALPGRIDIQAPLGDNEPEMPFWMDAAIKLVSVYQWPDGKWLIHHLPPSRLTAAALARLLDMPDGGAADDRHPPDAMPVEHPSAISLRSGWNHEDCLVAVGASRYPMGHLHCDGGHIAIGSRGRFWITDPGYQQYREGAEREYSIGIEAHNAPVLDGIAQTERGTEVLLTAEEPDGQQRVSLDLTRCYTGIAADIRIYRDVMLFGGDDHTVVVRDGVRSGHTGMRMDYSWQSGTYLAWSFQGHWARLGEGGCALWIATFSVCPGMEESQKPIQLELIEPAQLYCHEGSRGTQTLRHSRTLTSKNTDLYWIFYLDKLASWEPPGLSWVNDRIAVRNPDRS